MSLIETKQAIQSALSEFASKPLADAATALLEVLGYKSEKRMPLKPNTAANFAKSFVGNRQFNEEQAQLADWKSVDFLFQLTDEEVLASSTGQQLLFSSKEQLDGKIIESYLFFAIDLKRPSYTRTQLAGITRTVNRLFDMPVMLLFQHGDTLTLAIINRRLHKRDQAKDVLEKVTLIKDINFADPIRAHLEILNDFVLPNLDADFGVSNFVRLHEAWQKRLGSYALSNEFYREIADWYFWAHHQVEDGTIKLPKHCDTEQEQSLFLIRLLTRVIFSWFLIEKRLIPNDLFREHRLKTLLKDFNPSKDPQQPDTSPAYYRAVLQNLFFGTLNMPSEQRAFREKKKSGERYDKNFGITNLWRYESSFRNTDDWTALAARIPFLNGGLFDCLDDKAGKNHDNFILDGFSDREDHGCHLPNDLFFGRERTVDLSRDYGEEDKRTARSKKAKVRGLIEILSRYKFTIEENTPLEEEIALDPELLGKVFENLLASYNEDTRTTARKALGAFYTPREIVSYMVDEALKSYLTTQVPRCKGALDDLFSNKATLKEIKPDTRDALIAAIGRVKILDPACGSGAFPMGALHRLVDLLQKLDDNNEKWREIQRRRAVAETEDAFNSGDRESREIRLKEINETFEFNSSDYGRKLYLIENSIYGVDIQPIATQIAKLRFFISLVVDQKVEPKAPNLGVRPLPNLETRLVAADTLIPIEKAKSDLFSGEIDRLRAELAAIRHEHFNARSPKDKRKWRDADAAKRQEIADYLDREHAIPRESAKKLAAWDPYDQNTFAPFFDSEWMFGLRDGFDCVVANPPYVDSETMTRKMSSTRAHLTAIFATARGNWDLFVVFIEKGFELLRDAGSISFIVPNKLLGAPYAASIRSLMSQHSISELRDYSRVRVFKQADVYPIVFSATKTPPVNAVRMTVMADVDAVTSARAISRDVFYRDTSWDRYFSTDLAVQIDEKCSRFATLETYLPDISGAATVAEAYELREVMEEHSAKTKKPFRRLINTGTIDRYCSLWGKFSTQYLKRSFKHPVANDVDIQGINVKRLDQARSNKLIVAGMTKVIECFYDEGLYLAGKSTVIILEGRELPLKYVIGILNSKLVTFWYQNHFKSLSLAGGYLRIGPTQIRSIPIPPADAARQREIVRLVEQVQHCKALNHENNTRELEEEIDGHVYQLYALSPEEVDLVEKSTKG